MNAHVAAYPQWLSPLVEFLFPPLCLGCGSAIETEPAICPTCNERIDRLEEPVCINCFNQYRKDSERSRCCEVPIPLFAFATYRAPYDEIVKWFKFHGVTFPAALAAEALCETHRASILSVNADALVPIPLHVRREKWRGFNQAATFAEQLARRLEIPVETDLLFRNHARQPQSKLTLAKRAGNIGGVFEADPFDSMPKRVVLVDDVVTSGMTMQDAGRACLAAGVRVVGCISMALSTRAAGI